MIVPMTSCDEHPDRVCVFYAGTCPVCEVEVGVNMHICGKPERVPESKTVNCLNCGVGQVTCHRGFKVIDEDDDESA